MRFVSVYLHFFAGMAMSLTVWLWIKNPKVFLKLSYRLLFVFVSSYMTLMLTSLVVIPPLSTYANGQIFMAHYVMGVVSFTMGVVLGSIAFWLDKS